MRDCGLQDGDQRLYWMVLRSPAIHWLSESTSAAAKSPVTVHREFFLAVFVNGDGGIRGTAHGGAIPASLVVGDLQSTQRSQFPLIPVVDKRPSVRASSIASSGFKTPATATTIHRPPLTHLLHHPNPNLLQA